MTQSGWLDAFLFFYLKKKPLKHFDFRNITQTAI